MIAHPLGIAGVLVAIGLAGLRAQSAPTLILTNANVFTADSSRPRAEAVAIRDAHIVAVGASAEIAKLATATTRRIDLGGRVVIPGFNDAHAHVGCWNTRARWVQSGDDLIPDPPLSAVADSLRALAAREPEGTWLAAQVGPTIMDDATARRAALDRVAPRHPVMLVLFGGHGAVLNSAALRALGISETARDPLGGRYEREPGSDRVNGAVQEYAAFPILPRVCSMEAESTLVRALQSQGRWMLRHGITSFQSFTNALDPALELRVIRAANLPQRVRVIPTPFTSATGRRVAEWRQALPGEPISPPVAGRMVRISGIKWILDGTPIERGAAHRFAYRDRPGHFGTLNFPPDTIRAMLLEARAARQQPLLHAGGDSTIAVVFDAMERTGGSAAWRPVRVRIEHGDALLPDLRERARNLGVVVVQNPTHFGLSALAPLRYDSATLAGFQPMKSLVRAGIPIALGADANGEEMNPFLNIMLATLHPVNPAEALTREQAVIAYTRGSAYAEMAEREKGTIAPGMVADLAVLSQDIFTVPPTSLPQTTSVLTIIGGRVVLDELSGSPAPRPRQR